MPIRVLILSVLLATMVAMEPVRADDARPPAGVAAGKAAVARMLAEALLHKDAATRRARLDALARDGSKEALSALGTILLKGDDMMRQAALDALIAAGENGGADVLADFLWKGGWVWRIKVIEALRAWGSPKAMPALRIAVKDPEYRVRQAGKGAMSIVAARIAQAREAATKARLKAVAALVDGANPQAQALLKAALSDQDARVRAMAALVLGRLKTRGAADILKALGDDKGPGVKAAAKWAQLRLAGGQVSEARVDLAEKLRKPLTRGAPRMSLADCIGRFEKECGVSILVNWAEFKRLGVETDRLVSYDSESLAAALDSLLRLTGEPRIDWKAEHDIVFVSSVETMVRRRLHTCEVPMDSVDTTPQATRSIRTRLALRSPRQEFDAVPFSQCIDFVRESGNVDVFVRWGKRGVDKVTPSTRLTARAADASVADLLGLLLRSQPDWPWSTHAAYAVVDGMILISSPKDLARWRQSRPKGLNVVEAMIEEEIRLGKLAPHKVMAGRMVRNECIDWLIETDRATTAANVVWGFIGEGGKDVITCGLFWSMVAGRVKMTRMFVDAGADVNSHWRYMDKSKDPPLVWANTTICPPLHFAAWLGNAEIVGILMRAGAKPDVVTVDAGSPLHVAVGRGNYMAVAALLAGGADVEIEWKGTRPLHLAAEAGRERVVSLLVDKGARVNSPSKTGTPLQRARAALKQVAKELENAVGKRTAELQARIAALRAVARVLETHVTKAP